MLLWNMLSPLLDGPLKQHARTYEARFGMAS
jgi:hypothetical protein